jgi:uncharacterized protein YchJ
MWRTPAYVIRATAYTAACCLPSVAFADQLPPSEAAMKFRYSAAFLTQESQSQLQHLVPPTLAESQTNINLAHHTTIKWRPAGTDLQQATQSAGSSVTVRVLAAVEDEHCRAVLVAVDGAPGVPASSNSHPHITIACCSTAPYTAVYSNVLLQRAEAIQALIIERDREDRPTSASVPTGSSWEGILAEYTTGARVFPATTAKVTIFPVPLTLHAVVCISDKWNDSTSGCDVESIRFALHIADKLTGGSY